MHLGRTLILTLMTLCPTLFTTAYANVLEVSAGLAAGRFSQGVNLTGSELTADIATEWSSNTGWFTTLACFANDNRTPRRLLQRGCDARMGWFTPVNSEHAVSFAVSRHDYSSPTLSGWEYTDVSLNWHIGKNHTLELRASDDLLGRGFGSVTTRLQAFRPIGNHWSVHIDTGLIGMQRAAPVSSLHYGMLGLRYSRGRWVTEFKAMLSDSAYQQFANLDFNQSELGISIRYRVY